MQVTTQIHQDLVLVGGGHSHVLALRMLAMKPIAGLRITLISPVSHTPYSGMLPGLIAGHYSFEQTHIDLARLCQWAGVRFLAAEVTALDPQARCLTLAGRPDVNYDVVSIDIGVQPELDSVPGAREYATAVKPVASLWRRWQLMYERITENAPERPYHISVVGGGAGSVELALAMAHRLGVANVKITLWCAGGSILQAYNPRARKSVLIALARLNIDVLCNARVVAVEEKLLTIADGRQVPFDDVFWCTSAAAARWIADSGLPVDERGFMQVRDTLQSLDDDHVFGAGDIATQVQHPRPKAGVYAVRQAPVLSHNLRAFLLGKPLRQHRPQQQFLSLLSLGDKRATADRGPFTATGQWVWRWKDRIDGAFMQKFENLPVIMPRGNWGSLPELDAASTQAACGGCGAKVGADILVQSLGQLTLDYPLHCVSGGDDVAPIPKAANSVVQSVDVLRQIVDDPWQMGRIAANHALSDLYASGAQPLSALAVVTLPFAGSSILQRELQQILSGALHEFSAVNCCLTGGHTMQGPEFSLGFVVNGQLSRETKTGLTKTGAKPGDQLVLTKPLGIGILFAAHMQLAADGRDVSAALACMVQSNSAAAQIALAHSARACTDVTGFGLAGHLLEMLDDELAARLQLQELPLLAGALQHLHSGIYSTMHAANSRSGMPFLIREENVESAHFDVLFDPQTSGGLLIACPAQNTSSLIRELHAADYPAAAVIGEITQPPSHSSSKIIVGP